MSQIQALNYCAHAIDDLRRTADLLYEPKGSRVVKEMIPILRSAEKFILPENGELLDTNALRPEFFDLMRLPFPVVALEIPTPHAKPSLRSNAGANTKVILLARELGQNGERTIAVTPFAYFPSLDCWTMCDYVAYFRPGDRCISGDKGGAVMGSDVISISTGERLEDETRLVDGVPCMPGEANDDMVWLINFCCTVNCENVRTESIAAPSSLNKKRIASDKEPFFSCRVLTIPGGSGARSNSGGTHNSPRLHLRRGHLRRMQTGKVTWVRHCMVGNPDKGVAEKTYAVRA